MTRELARARHNPDRNIWGVSQREGRRLLARGQNFLRWIESGNPCASRIAPEATSATKGWLNAITLLMFGVLLITA